MKNLIPKLGDIGFVAGVLIGLIGHKGIWCIVGGISLMWFGNGISGWLRGEITTALGHFTSKALHYTKDAEPKRFWFQIIMELLMGAIFFIVFLKSPFE